MVGGAEAATPLLPIIKDYSHGKRHRATSALYIIANGHMTDRERIELLKKEKEARAVFLVDGDRRVWRMKPRAQPAKAMLSLR